MKRLIKAACFLTLLMYAGSVWGTNVHTFYDNDPLGNKFVCENMDGQWKLAKGRSLDTCKLGADVTLPFDVQIIIARDDMIFDGNEKDLYGYLDACVYLDNVTGVTVKDLYVYSCTNGVYIEDGSNNTIKGIETGAIMTPTTGIYVDDSDRNTIKDNELEYLSFGIILTGSNDNSVKFNCIKDVGTGISLEGRSGDNSVKENNIKVYSRFIILSEAASAEGGNTVVRNHCESGPCDVGWDLPTDNKVAKNDPPINTRVCPEL